MSGKNVVVFILSFSHISDSEIYIWLAMSFSWNLTKNEAFKEAMRHAIDHKSPALVLQEIGEDIEANTFGLIYGNVVQDRTYEGTQRTPVTIAALVIVSNIRDDTHGGKLAGRLLEVHYLHDTPWKNIKKIIAWNPSINAKHREIKLEHLLGEVGEVNSPEKLKEVVGKLLEMEEIDKWLASLIARQ